jgi:hypothetical protein
MEYLLSGHRKFYLYSFEDVIQNIFKDEKYVVLVDVRTEDSITQVKEKANFLVSSYCKEIYCIGHFAEKLHDVFDEYIEDNFLFDIMTSADADTTVEDSCFYFFESAGRDVLNLFAFLDNDKDIKDKLIDYFLQSRSVN